MLKSRRDRGDLIQLFRYFKIFDNINLSNAPKFSNAITKGIGKNLYTKVVIIFSKKIIFNKKYQQE